MVYITAHSTDNIASNIPIGLPRSKFCAPTSTSISIPIVDITMPIMLLRVTRSRRNRKAKIGAISGPVDNNAAAIVGELKAR